MPNLQTYYGSIDFKTIGTFLVVFLSVLYFMRQKRYHLPPGPWGVPFIGHVVYFMGKGIQIQEVFTKWSKKYGSIIRLRFGQWNVVVLNKWDVIKEALITKQNDFAGRPKLPSGMMMTDGGKDILMSNYGPVWRYHRKVAHTAMRNYSSGKSLEKLVNHGCGTFFKAIDEEEKNGIINIRPIAYLLSINVSMGMCFGKYYKYDDEDFVFFKKLIQQFLDSFGNGLPEDFFPIAKYFPSTKRTEFKKLLNQFNGILQKEYDDHKEKFTQENVIDLCDHMLSAQREAMEEDSEKADVLTDTHLVMTLLDVFGAGIDTVTFTIVYLIVDMIENPQVQERMYEEIVRVVGKGNPPTLAMKQDLRYTEAVIYESMRMRTIAPLALPHATMCDTTVGSYDVPKDTMIFVNIAAIHMDPEMWEDPGTFNPERFLGEDGKPHRPEGFIPFSAGRRVCLGEALAKNELMLLIPQIFGKYKFSAPPGKGLNIEMEDIGFVQFPKEFDIHVEVR